MGERVLLAGCGDLGLRVAQRLLARGDEVWALRRQPPIQDGGGIRWLRGDLTRPESLRRLPDGITQLVYLPTPDRRDEAAYRATFVDGLRHLLVAIEAVSPREPSKNPARHPGASRDPGTGGGAGSHGVSAWAGMTTTNPVVRVSLQRLLLVSSSAVYGEHGGDWVDEDTPPAPPGFNGGVLLEAEQLLAARRPHAVVLRLAGLYGPGRMQLLERLHAGAVRVPRTLPHWANRIHVDDAAAAIAHLLQQPDPLPLYVGADSTPLPLDVLYDHLAGLTGAPPPGDGPPPAGVGSKRLSNARLRDSGWAPQWPDARDGYAALLDM